MNCITRKWNKNQFWSGSILLLLIITSFKLYAQPLEKKSLPHSFALDTPAIHQRFEVTRQFELAYPDSAEKAYKEIFLQSTQAGFTNGILLTLFQLGNIALRTARYNMAVGYFSLGIRYCDTIQHKGWLTSFYSNLGNAYNNLPQFELAYKAYAQAAYHSKDKPAQLAIIYNNLATVLGQMNQFEKALSYINQALGHLADTGAADIHSILLMNKGRCYYELHDYKQSAGYIDSAIRMARKQGLKLELMAGLLESARVDIAIEQPQKALPKLLEAVELGKEPGMPANKKNEAISTLGYAYLQLKNYTQAEHYLLWAWQNAESIPKEKLFLQERLAELYSLTQNYKKAYQVQKEYIQLKDSIQSKEVALNVNEIETKYRTSEKDKEITKNRLQISDQQKRIAEKNSLIFGITCVAMFVITLLFSRYFYVRQKNRKLESQQEIQYLKAVMEGEQRERIRIATDLHDGIVSELTTVKMNLATVRYSDQVHQDNYRKVLHQLDETINDVRNTAHNLMPEILLRYNLAQAVELLCTSIQKTGRLRIEFQSYGDFSQLPMELRQAVYRIIQELLHNVIKHAQATEALIQLSCYNHLLTATIEDNGLGIEKNSKKRNKGMGLHSIEQRVRHLNGIIEWSHKNTGSGTNVYLEFEV